MRIKKSLSYLVFFIILLNIFGCNEDPVSSYLKVEEKINAQRPLSMIRIYSRVAGGNYYFSRGSDQRDGKIVDAYAESGYLIVITPHTTYSFSLSSATSIEIEKNKLFISYYYDAD